MDEPRVTMTRRTAFSKACGKIVGNRMVGGRMVGGRMTDRQTLSVW